MAGEAVSVVSADTPFSESAARRHIRMHMQPRLAVERQNPASTLHVSDFASRLLALANKAAAISAYADETNDGRLALQAMQQERELLDMLMTRLGVTDQEAVETLAEVKAVVRGLQRAITANATGDLEALAWYIREEGGSSVADALLSRHRLNLTAADEGATP